MQVGIILQRNFRSRPLIFLELVLASMDKPVVVPGKDKVTMLTGKVDYAVLSLLQPEQLKPEAKISESGKVVSPLS